MNYDAFFDKIHIEDVDKNKAIYYLETRGISEHIFVAEYLQSLKTDKVTYEEIATAFRYDKRIRRIIYKYIGYLEEYLRAYLTNHYINNGTKFEMTKVLSGLLDKYKDFYLAISQLTFGNLMLQIKKLPEGERKNIFKIDTKNKNLDALVGLRNEVNHNRFLLHNKSLRSCTVGTFSGSSLWTNIINLSNHLPENIRKSFIEEIENSKEPGEINYEKQVKWDLLKEVIIEIEF